jgi:DNA-binding NtrC family response regulator
MSEIKSTHPNVPVILMTDIDVSTAVKAIKTVRCRLHFKPFNLKKFIGYYCALQISETVSTSKK